MSTTTAPKPVWQLVTLVSIFCGVASGVSLKLAVDMPNTQAVTIRVTTAFVVVLIVTFLVAGRLRITMERPTVTRAVLDGVAGVGFALAVFELPISLLTVFRTRQQTGRGHAQIA